MMLGTLYYARIYKSTDGGLNFAAASTGITESNNSSTAPFLTRLTTWSGDATGNTVFTYSNTKVYKSTNYAGSWTALGITGLPTGIFMRNLGVAPSQREHHRRGRQRRPRVPHEQRRHELDHRGQPLPNNGLSMSDVAFDPTNPNIVYVSSVAPDGTKNHLWKSTDFGASWTAIENGLPAGVPVNGITSTRAAT